MPHDDQCIAAVLRRTSCAAAFALVALYAATPTAHAQVLFEFLDDFGKSAEEQREPFEERIETERHDFTQSAVTVGRSMIQVEGGYSYFYKDADEEIEGTHTTPEMLLRIGLSEDIEFRIRWNHAWQFVQDEEDFSGAEDLRYSLKLQLTRERECSCLPTSAVELRASAPTGSEGLTTERVEFSTDFIYQWQILEFATLAGSTGYATSGFGDIGLLPKEPTEDRFNVYSQSVVLGLELSGANTMYAEWFGIFSDGLAEEFTIAVFNIGIDHYLTDDLVVDWRIGTGLNDDTDDLFTGVGGGYRF